MKVYYLCLLLILMTGCSQSSPTSAAKPTPSSHTSESESSYPDFINVGDKHYINAWELTLLDATGIVEMGQVDRGSLVAEGTPAYSIPSYPEHDVVVVKAESNHTGLVANVTGYLVYVRNGGDGKSYYPDIEDQPVRQIKIFRGTELLRELEGQEKDSFFQLFRQQGPHNEFHFDVEPRYTVLLIGENVLGQNYGIMEKDSQFGLPHIESKLPDEIGHYFKE
ncbi:hypothetical protein ACFQZR_12495 [Paenibacillus sp. GCM10027629]|uniref:hypothetical protein n=1 Tax=Paenibacillus sp. GCM10027629 TaxID=3273414 RepID=UPI00362B50CC